MDAGCYIFLSAQLYMFCVLTTLQNIEKGKTDWYYN
jgi:hypothetical protein